MRTQKCGANGISAGWLVAKDPRQQDKYFDWGRISPAEKLLFAQMLPTLLAVILKEMCGVLLKLYQILTSKGALKE